MHLYEEVALGSADHLAQMMELIGPFSRGFALSGKCSRQYFDKNGQLKNIRDLNFWPLQQVLADKYRFPKEVAQGIAEFLMPMLEINPLKRASAQQMLKHSFLRDVGSVFARGTIARGCHSTVLFCSVLFCPYRTADGIGCQAATWRSKCGRRRRAARRRKSSCGTSTSARRRSAPRRRTATSRSGTISTTITTITTASSSVLMTRRPVVLIDV
jgi:hypothetical protein